MLILLLLLLGTGGHLNELCIDLPLRLGNVGRCGKHRGNPVLKGNLLDLLTGTKEWWSRRYPKGEEFLLNRGHCGAWAM